MTRPRAARRPNSQGRRRCWSSRACSPPARPDARSCSCQRAGAAAVTPGAADFASPRPWPVRCGDRARRPCRHARAQAVCGALLRRLRFGAGPAAADPRRRDHPGGRRRPGRPECDRPARSPRVPLRRGRAGPAQRRRPSRRAGAGFGRTRARPRRRPSSAERLEGFGRARAERRLRSRRRPRRLSVSETGVLVQRQIIPEWALRLLVATLLLGPLLLAVDALARLRRRREAVGRWTVWTLACALPFFSARCSRVCSGGWESSRCAPATRFRPARCRSTAPRCGRSRRFCWCSGSPGFVADAVRRIGPDLRPQLGSGRTWRCCWCSSRCPWSSGPSTRSPPAAAAGGPSVAADRLAGAAPSPSGRAGPRGARAAAACAARRLLRPPAGPRPRRGGAGPRCCCWPAGMWGFWAPCCGALRSGASAACVMLALTPSAAVPGPGAAPSEITIADRGHTPVRAHSAALSRLCAASLAEPALALQGVHIRGLCWHEQRDRSPPCPRFRFDPTLARAPLSRRAPARRALAVCAAAPPGCWHRADRRRRAGVDRRRRDAGLAGAAVRPVREAPPGPPVRRAAQDRTRRRPRRLSAERSPACRTSAARIAFLARDSSATLRRRRGRAHRDPAHRRELCDGQGTGTDELRAARASTPQTSFPGIAGTTAIAGHRTTYLAPFRHIDALPGWQSDHP